MPIQQSFERISLDLNGDTIQIKPNDGLLYYEVDGSGALLGNITIAAIGTPQDGDKFILNWNASVAIGANTITVFGLVLSTDQAQSVGMRLEFTYVAATATYDQSVLMPRNTNDYVGTKEVVLTNGGGTVNLVPGKDKNTIYITGNPNMAASWVIQGAGSPQDGDTFNVIYRATSTLNGNTINIFGYNLSAQDALTGNINVKATYTTLTSSWLAEVTVDAATASYDFEGADTTTIVAAQPNIVLTVGENKKTQILEGTATLVNSFSVTANTPPNDVGEFWVEVRGNFDLNGNAITIFGISLSSLEASTGGIAIHGQYDSGTASWIGTLTPLGTVSPTTLQYVSVLVPAASVLTANSIPVALIPAPTGGGKINVVDAHASIDFNSAAYNAHTTVNIITGTATKSQFQFSTFLAATVSKCISGSKTAATGATDTQVIANQGVFMTTDGGDPGVGDSDVTIELWYTIS